MYHCMISYGYIIMIIVDSCVIWLFRLYPCSWSNHIILLLMFVAEKVLLLLVISLTAHNTSWYSSYILQPPKYLLLFVNRFRYLNNNIIKDRCPIPLDATVMLGPLKFNLQATIDHHGPSIDSGHYTASINCCKKKFYCNDHKITEFGITDKNSSTAYIVLYKWIDTWFLDSDRRVGVWSLPWRWHILSIPLTTGRGTSAETCGLDDVFPPDDLGSRPGTLC